jgi:acetolactate synthase I/II/III large subunit
MPDTVTAAKYVLDALQKQSGSTNVIPVFVGLGGLIDDFMAAFGGNSPTPCVVAHETGAGFMADGYARASGSFGVCMAIGGPGAANLVPAMASAYADKSPVLAICGEVPSDWEGRGAFQDAHATDLEMMQPVSAFAREVPVVTSVAHDLRVALRTMQGNPQRPVFLSLPQQIQGQQIAYDYQALKPQPTRAVSFSDQVTALTSGPQLAILAGNGAVRSVDPADLVALADKFKIPVATTLRAKGFFPENHPMSLGVFGYGGTRWATIALTPQDDSGPGPTPQKSAQANVLLILGSALDQRDTLYRRNAGLSNVTVQVDADPTTFGRNYPVSDPVAGDAGAFVKWMLKDDALGIALKATQAPRESWLELLKTSWARYYDPQNMSSNAVPIHPARVVAELQKAAPANLMLLVDSGAHRAFAAHYWSSTSRSPGARTFVATTMAPMGWAIAAGLGAKLARPELPCAVITGDGCMLMHGMEIQTAARYWIKVVYIVINNSAHGIDYLRAKDSNMPPAAQKLTTLPQRDWVKFAKAFGAGGKTVLNPGDLEGVLKEAFAASGPYVVDIHCDPNFEPPLYPWKKAQQTSFD